MERKVMIFRALAIAALVAFNGLLTSCEKYVWSTPELPADIVISFSGNILPVCNGCHTSWSNETAYAKLSARVDTVTPESSSILTFHSSALQSNMIQINDTLVLKATDVIKLWASQGAESN